MVAEQLASVVLQMGEKMCRRVCASVDLSPKRILGTPIASNTAGAVHGNNSGVHAK